MNASATARQKLQDFWQKRFAVSEYVYGMQPNEFLVTHRSSLPARGRVLCLADGEGRNGVWLAQQGLEVTSVDIAASGMAKAQRLAAQNGVRIEAIVADVTAYDVGIQQWDAIVSIFLHLPASLRAALHQRCISALKPGGVFVWEAYGPEQFGQTTGGPQDLALLPSLSEVARDFESCQMEHSFSGWRPIVEGIYHSGTGSVTQLIARQPA